MRGDERRDQIAANIERVEGRIATACAAAGRERSDVTVVAVTKTFPVEDVIHLHALGVRDVGENRDQDASRKVDACRAAGVTDLVWHFVGQVQRNKAATVTAYADMVHSVDRLRLVSALQKGATASGRKVTCLVQVDLRDVPVDDGRGGAAPPDVDEIAAALAGSDALVLGGLMAVAPLDGDPASADRAFARLSELSQQLRSTLPSASVVSAGMSGDLEQAVAHGATHLRIGSALLGSRPALG